MDSAPKIATIAKEEEEDRLSNLPSSVICHILSFMPTKYAARTSILSKMWKYLFLGVPRIDLQGTYQLIRPERSKDFFNFVNRRLMLGRTSSITEFRLICDVVPEPSKSNLWLTTLLLRNIHILDIDLWDEAGCPSLCPPNELFVSKTIQVLKLGGMNIVLKIPEFVCLPQLKVLHLKYLSVQSECSHFKFSQGYPLLEDLKLIYIRFPENAVLGILVATLKRIALTVGYCMEPVRVDIDTPNLQHIECSLQDDSRRVIQLNLVSCEFLVSAKFERSLLCESHWFLKLLCDFNKIKYLHLSALFLKDLGRCGDLLPTFPNLIHLQLTPSEDSMWILLQRSPILEELDCVMGGMIVSAPPESGPPCFTENLREIRIRGFEGDEDDFAVVRYFLEHAAALKRMIIVLASHLVEKCPVSILQSLLKLRRRSPKCEVELLGS
ncbi:OLC1v1013652C1 [Oldenlandia corymbosa var. corymbosa]|uniref:OLC1v1013652C1 n=1 Tax=Oldenlandia corymbosa var. corymbosa TaxID=529605 RepID=A0AAV1DZ55_OLDCO|nr:OLC1v1013652C1 [Oldenlandia corymbosa var. corymbosa]